MEDLVVFIIGTTAVGKTQLSLDLCTHFDGEVVSADSMQIYQMADLMTAKASAAEQAAVPHHMIDLVSPLTDDYDVRAYQTQALAAISEVRARGKLPVVVGGTLYYIEALLFERGLDSAELGEIGELELLSTAELHAQLTSLDSQSAAVISATDRRRLINAVRYVRATGQSYQLKDAESRVRFPKSVVVWLHCPPDVLEARVRARTHKMLEEGGLAEVERILSLSPERDFTRGVLQSIGYKELQPYFTGSAPLAECAEALINATLKYAKKQLKWIRNRLALHLQLVSLDTSAPWGEVARAAIEAVVETRTVSCESFVLDKPRPYSCQRCHKTLRGESEWRTHLKSRGHRKRKGDMVTGILGRA
jgi:tRNA dimethylallyltransferase